MFPASLCDRNSSAGRASDCASGRWLDAGLIELYRKRQPTISQHRQTIAKHMRRVKLPDLLIEVDNQ
jgi:hypothetical protein